MKTYTQKRSLYRANAEEEEVAMMILLCNFLAGESIEYRSKTRQNPLWKIKLRGEKS
jgi:predicted kinase